VKTRPTGLARVAVDALEDMKGTDIRVLDVKKLTTVTDWMIVATGTSSRHVKSLADNVVRMAKEGGVRPRGAQGMEMGEWVLVDLGEVVVHVMQAQTRAFYQLEKLWDVQPEGPTPAEPKPRKKKAAAKAKPKPKAPAKASAKARKRPVSRLRDTSGGAKKRR
jgi:ribosome-associated protein